MKITEVVKPKYNFEAVFKSLPKEFKDAMKNIHDMGVEYYPDYIRQGGKLKNDIAPAVCRYFFDCQQENEALDVEDTVEEITSRFRMNYDVEEDDEEDDDFDRENLMMDFSASISDELEGAARQHFQSREDWGKSR